MKITKSDRGFQFIMWPNHVDGEKTRLVSQSSATDLEHAPGETWLWIGEHHHLDVDEVSELIGHLQAWVKTGSLKTQPKKGKK